MAAVRKLLGRGIVLAALGGLIQVGSARAEPAVDPSLLFDPGALDASASIASRNNEREATANGWNWTSPLVLDLPGIADNYAASHAKPNLESLRSKELPASAGGNSFDPRLMFGKLSIGVEAAADSKPRPIVGNEPYADIDSIIDQRHQRTFAPFIGLSAKSTLQ